MPNLDALLRAKSVAVIGASAKRGSFGWHVVRQLLDFGYSGRILPVNPAYTDIENLICLPSVHEISETVDCAAICVADQHIESAMADVARAGIPAAVIFGSAAGRTEDGKPLAARIVEIARQADIALMGANCMGFFNFADRLFLTGYPYHQEPSCGAISFITHSGSMLSAVAKNTRGMNFNYVISSGQELVLTAAHFLEFVLRQSETRVVGLFLETIRDPERFLAALELASERDIPVVLLKVGRTERGAEMAMAHSGALAVRHAAIEAVADRYGVTLVRTVEEMLDTLELFASGRRAPTNYLGAITDSGGERGLLVDLAADAGVSFAQLAEATMSVLESHLEAGLMPGNPADLWGTGREWQSVYRGCVEAMLKDPAVGGFNFGIDFNIGSRLGPDYREIAIQGFHSTTKPFAVIANVAAGLNPDDASLLRAAGVPVLAGTETGLLAFRHLFAYSQGRRDCQFDGGWRPKLPPLAPEQLAFVQKDRALTEFESCAVLSQFGLRSAQALITTDESAALSAANQFGYPVVLKTAEIGVLHKSDRGGVRSNLTSGGMVLDTYREISARFGPAVLVQKHVDVSRGVELFLGMTIDSQFGPVVTVGFGGNLVEIFNDSVTLLAPCRAAELVRRLEGLRGYDLLGNVRGRDPIDIGALAEVVEQFSVAAAVLAPWVAEIDINPLLAIRDQFTMLDALIVPATAKTAAASTG